RFLLIDDLVLGCHLFVAVGYQAALNLGLLLAAVEFEQGYLHLSQGVWVELQGRGRSGSRPGHRVIPRRRLGRPRNVLPSLGCWTRSRLRCALISQPEVLLVETKPSGHPVRHLRSRKGGHF